MARANNSPQSKPKYIYQLPYLPQRDLARILDDNNQWQELGGVHLQYDVTTLNEFGRTRSPTFALFADWGQKNHTITELFIALSRMQHYRALEILKPYVDEKYHALYDRGELSLTRLLKPDLGGASALPGTSKSDALTARDKCAGAEKSSLDSCNFNNPERDRPSSANKLVGLDLLTPIVQQPIVSTPPIAINQATGDNATTKSDNLSGWNNNALTPSPRVPTASPQLGPAVNSPQRRRDSESSAFSDFSSASAMSSIPPIDEGELASATNQWNVSSVLGKGGFGTVYKGTWKNTQVAIKRMENKGLAAANVIPMQQSMGELRILNAVRHDNILPLYGYSLGGDFPCLVYQFMPNGSLEDRLLCRQSTPPLVWEQRLNVARGTARGLQFLHTMSDKPLIHGDIKSANILLDKNMEPKIGDFGLAREGPHTHYTHIKVSRVHGTRPYLPDEYLRGRKISTKVDTYSFGIVLFELCTGLRAYDHQRECTYLRDHVESTDLDTLPDVKAGTDCIALFKPLMHLGMVCAATNAKDRPEMVKVLKDLDHLALQTEEYISSRKSLSTSIAPPTIPPPVVQPPAPPQVQPALPPTSNGGGVGQLSSVQPSEDQGLPDLDRILNLSTTDYVVPVPSDEIPALSALIQSGSCTDVPSTVPNHSSRMSSSSSSDTMNNIDSSDSSDTSDESIGRPTNKKNLPCLSVDHE